MSANGRAAQIRIKDDANSNNVNSYANAKLQLSKKKGVPKVYIMLPPDNDIAHEFDLDDCSYVKASSSRGVVECFHINSENQTVIIITPDENCRKLLDEVHTYLGGNNDKGPPSPAPPRNQSPPRGLSPPPNKISARDREPDLKPNPKANELVQALNNSSADRAAQLARELAAGNHSIGFALDMVNESGNAKPRPPPAPVVELLKIKLSIESFLIENCSNEQYEVTIVKGASIKDLKQLVKDQANIETNQQYWYINRDLLPDTYAFGVSKTPRITEQTVLILYIAKPQNN